MLLSLATGKSKKISNQCQHVVDVRDVSYFM